MDFDYNFGNEYYKYFDDIGLQVKKYKILAPEQEQKNNLVKNILWIHYLFLIIQIIKVLEN